MRKLPLFDARRIKCRDDKLWVRDKKQTTLYKFSKIPCPCQVHKGIGLSIKLEEIERHLLGFGCSPDCRTWRGLDDPDSSDEERENNFSRKNAVHSWNASERNSSLQMRQMMHTSINK